MFGEQRHGWYFAHAQGYLILRILSVFEVTLSLDAAHLQYNMQYLPGNMSQTLLILPFRISIMCINSGSYVLLWDAMWENVPSNMYAQRRSTQSDQSMFSACLRYQRSAPRRFWPDCAEAQADLYLRCVYMSGTLPDIEALISRFFGKFYHINFFILFYHILKDFSYRFTSGLCFVYGLIGP